MTIESIIKKYPKTDDCKMQTLGELHDWQIAELIKMSIKKGTMENLLLEMLEKAKENKKAFLKLKNLAVELQIYELGAELRQIELELFVESESEKEAKEIQVALQMVQLNADLPNSWALFETFKTIREKGKEFSLKDAARIIAEKERIF